MAYCGTCYALQPAMAFYVLACMWFCMAYTHVCVCVCVYVCARGGGGRLITAEDIRKRGKAGKADGLVGPVGWGGRASLGVS